MTQLAINGGFIGQYALSVYAPKGQFAGAFQAALTSGQSSGIVVYGGTTATDTCVNFLNSSGTIEYFQIWGDGHGSLATGMTWDVNGAFTIATPTADRAALIIYGTQSVSNEALTVYGSTTAGKSLGVFIQAGTTSTDTALYIRNATGSQNFLEMYGDGHGTMGGPSGNSLAWAAVGNFTFTSSIGVQGATPAVTANQTDIGTTTTGTVITTAGGIALPALAKTFWVVNVNGVAYGVPCFAL